MLWQPLQVLFGITEGIITGYEAATLLKEQPEYLRLDVRLAHEDEHVACVDKPCDIRLSVPRGGAAWTGEEGAPGGPWIGPASGLPCPEVTLHDWLKEQVPEVVTPGGEVRLCHQLDYSTSGLIVAASTWPRLGRGARCVRRLRAARRARANPSPSPNPNPNLNPDPKPNPNPNPSQARRTQALPSARLRRARVGPKDRGRARRTLALPLPLAQMSAASWPMLTRALTLTTTPSRPDPNPNHTPNPNLNHTPDPTPNPTPDQASWLMKDLLPPLLAGTLASPSP